MTQKQGAAITMEIINTPEIKIKIRQVSSKNVQVSKSSDVNCYFYFQWSGTLHDQNNTKEYYIKVFCPLSNVIRHKTEPLS